MTFTQPYVYSTSIAVIPLGGRFAVTGNVPRDVNIAVVKLKRRARSAVIFYRAVTK